MIEKIVIILSVPLLRVSQWSLYFPLVVNSTEFGQHL